MAALAPFLSTSIERLRQAGIDNPSLDARLLMCHALNCDRAELLSQSERVLTNAEIAAIENFLTRREQHESVARIMGFREFWGLEFGLNEATLEPRPDSETLIDAVLKNAPNPTPYILDLGTGTGCLLLSLLHEMPQATGIGIDLAPRAAEQAKKNAEKLGLNARAEFRVGNWFENVTEKFDVIISNPPYITSTDIADLMPDVRKHDPLAALDGGADGLDPYRLMIPQLKNFLNPKGLVAFEFGQGQAPQVADLLRQAGFINITLHKDLGGIERCITADS